MTYLFLKCRLQNGHDVKYSRTINPSLILFYVFYMHSLPCLYDFPIGEVAYFTQSVEATHPRSQNHWITEIRTNSDVVCFSSRPRDQEGWINLASKMFLDNAGLQPLLWKLSIFSRAEERPDLPWTPSLLSLQEPCLSLSVIHKNNAPTNERTWWWAEKRGKSCGQVYVRNFGSVNLNCPLCWFSVLCFHM